MKKIALSGPLAKYAAAHGGGSASLNCHYKISPYDAFTDRLGDHVEITHSNGSHIFRVYPDLEGGCNNAREHSGFLAEYFLKPDITASSTPCRTEEFPRGSFNTLVNMKVMRCKSARFTTMYKPLVSGNHHLSFSGTGLSKLCIDGVLVAEQTGPRKDAIGFFLGIQNEERIQFEFEPWKTYNLVMETHPSPVSNAKLYIRGPKRQLALLNPTETLWKGKLIHLELVSQEEMDQDVLAEATKLAREADVAVVFVGNTTQWETEG